MTTRARRSVLLTLALALAPAAADGQRSGRYQVQDVTDGGTLTGQVTFEGTVPRAKRFFITKDVEVCGMGYRERHEVELGNDRGLRNVVIVIEDIGAGKPWPDPPAAPELSQEDCVFRPHVLVVPRGRELRILNPDPVLHNIHAFELIGQASRTLFNFGQPPEDSVITQTIRPRRSHRIRVECDAHDFMLGWIFAADHPYTVVVDDNGRFTIDGIPPGTYTVRAWHPYLGEREQSITVAGRDMLELTFTFSAP